MVAEEIATGVVADEDADSRSIIYAGDARVHDVRPGGSAGPGGADGADALWPEQRPSGAARSSLPRRVAVAPSPPAFSRSRPGFLEVFQPVGGIAWANIIESTF
jgi:hypothetical protein